MQSWYGTLAELDPETPVIGVHDDRAFGRPVLVVLDDRERRDLSGAIDQARRDRDAGVQDRERQHWNETLWGRVSLVVLGVCAVVTAIASLYAALRPH